MPAHKKSSINPTRKRTPKLKEREILEAIDECQGMMFLAARRLGVSKTTLYKYRKQWPSIEEKQDEWRGVMIDKAESNLMDALDEGCLKTSRFVLSHLGKKRGYNGGDDQTRDATPVQIIIQPPNYPRSDDDGSG